MGGMDALELVITFDRFQHMLLDDRCLSRHPISMLEFGGGSGLSIHTRDLFICYVAIASHACNLCRHGHALLRRLVDVILKRASLHSKAMR